MVDFRKFSNPEEVATIKEMEEKGLSYITEKENTPGRRKFRNSLMWNFDGSTDGQKLITSTFSKKSKKKEN